MSLRSPQGARRPRRSVLSIPKSGQGFILPVMLIAGLVVTVGAATLTNRVLSMRIGEGFKDQAREARDAADTGLEAVLTELNRNENRSLAASGVGLQNWDATTLKLRNPCFNNASVAPSAEVMQLKAGAWRSVPGNPNQRYRIRAAEIKNFNRSARVLSTLVASNGGTTGISTTGTYLPSNFDLLPKEQQLNRLELTIEGQSLRNGVVVATSVISQELGVAPKCCGVSLGDSSTVPDNACASRFPRLLVGLDGGGVQRAGSGAQLREQVANSNSTGTTKPDRVLCVMNSSGTCGGTVSSVDGVPVQTMKLSPPALPAYPTVDGRTGLATGTDGFAIVADSIADDATLSSASATRSQAHQDYLRVNDDPSLPRPRVELCNVTQNNFTESGPITSSNPAGNGSIPNMPTSFVPGSCDSRIDSFCARTGNSAENYSYHCRISRLFVRDRRPCTITQPVVGNNDPNEWCRVQNNTFFIDSSRGRIFLHFNQAWVSSTAAGTSETLCGAPASGVVPGDMVTNEVICTQAGYDDGQIQHLFCSTSPNITTPCSTPADPDNSARATFYSDTSINIKIGDDGYLRDLFVYMPKGSLTLAEDPYRTDNAYGVPNYRGSLWINNLFMGLGINANNRTQIDAPPFSANFQGFGTPTIDNPFRLMPFYEWIVRGSSIRSLFGTS
jgi:hypothetical protein